MEPILGRVIEGTVTKMKSGNCNYSWLVKMYAVVLLIISVFDLCHAEAKPLPLSLILGFGASTIDTGNNDYINTTSKANFPPYGRDFPSHIATGRFSNGKLAIDFLSGYIGAKESVPPYLDPALKISDLLTGVSFASAGSGYDTITGEQNNVLSLAKQLELFKEYKARVVKEIGHKEALKLLGRALFFCNHGTNDLFSTFFLTGVRRKQYSLQQYNKFLIQAAQAFIEEIIKEGATRIAIVGVPPLGSLPAHKRMQNGQASPRKLNRAAYKFNGDLRLLIHKLSLQLPSHVKIVYVDIYNIITHLIQNPRKHGFDEAVEPCYAGIPKNSACPDASRYVFWDPMHVTQNVYRFQADIIMHRDVSRLV